MAVYPIASPAGTMRVLTTKSILPVFYHLSDGHISGMEWNSFYETKSRFDRVAGRMWRSGHDQKHLWTSGKHLLPAEDY